MIILRRTILRLGLLILLLTVCGVAWVASNPRLLPPDDYVAYWAAGRLNAQGMNPYDPGQVLSLERTQNWTNPIANRIWYPPWSVAALMPFGMMPYQPGRFLWYLLSVTILVLSADWLWIYFGGEPARRRAAWVLGLAFVPSVILVRTGQIGIFMLFGVAGFLRFEKERRWIAAGACLALIFIKPQLLYLITLSVLLWTLKRRRWGVLTTSALLCGAGTVVALMMNPSVIGEFLWVALRDRPYQANSTPGYIIRAGTILLGGHDRYWLQFVPPALGAIWLGFYWSKHRERWNWSERMPLIALVSLVSAAWTWLYDEVIFLVPVMQLAVVLIPRWKEPRFRGVLGLFILINIAILVMNVSFVNAFWYVWTPAAFLVWYLYAAKIVIGPVARATRAT